MESLKNKKSVQGKYIVAKVPSQPKKTDVIKVIEPKKVVTVKQSKLLHTTYIPSENLISKIDELLDYNPQKVIPFLYDHSDAIRVLLPVVIKKNKEIAQQFYDANIEKHPEIQAIYDRNSKVVLWNIINHL